MNSIIRVLMAKPGLDGHQRGALVVARALRDAGMEVIYSGIRQTPEAIVRIAEQEAVDVIGLSILSGAHMIMCEDILNRMKDRHIDDVIVVVGGTIPHDDIPKLKEMGVADVFGPGSHVPEIVAFIQDRIKQRRTSA